jgi:hypothetical protein
VIIGSDGGPTKGGPGEVIIGSDGGPTKGDQER